MQTTPRKGVAIATVAESGTTSTAIDVGDYKSGMVLFPLEFNGDTITFTHCETVGGTYAALGGTVTMTAATGWMALPAAVFSGLFIKLVTSVAVAAAAELKFALKS